MRNKAKAPRTSAAKKNPKPKTEGAVDYMLDDLESDVSHLCHLLDITVNGLLGNDNSFGSKIQYERASAVAWVARDLAETIKQKLEEGGGQPRSLTANAA
jgi:hypothetical protein